TSLIVIYVVFSYYIRLKSLPTRRSSDLTARISRTIIQERSSLKELSPSSDTPILTARFTSMSKLKTEKFNTGPANLPVRTIWRRSEEHTSELQSLAYLVCRLLLVKKNVY